MLLAGSHRVAELERLRGPRWFISATIRRDEFIAGYAVTADAAEAEAERLRADNYRQIRVTPPDGSVDLRQLGLEREQAQRALDDVMQRLRARVLTALRDEDRAEAEVARAAGVDRMTVRKWAGK